jgi:hypothetical protein
MKQALLFSGIAFLLAGQNAFAGSEFKVSVVNEGGNVSLRYVTTKTNSSMCSLKNTELKLTAPSSDLDSAEGKIEISTSVDLHAMCLTAFGPHRGATTFQRGRQLPALANGEYQLSLNGERYGKLVVSQDSARLVE